MLYTGRTCMHFVVSHVVCRCMSSDVHCEHIHMYTRYRCMCCMPGISACMVLYGVCGCMCVMHTMHMYTWWRRRNWVFVGCGNQSRVCIERTKA